MYRTMFAKQPDDSSPSGLVKRTEMFSSDRGGRGSRTLMGDDTPDLYADVTFTQILGGPAVGHDPHAGREYIDPSLDSVLRGKTESAFRMTSCRDVIGCVVRRHVLAGDVCHWRPDVRQRAV